MDKLTDWQTDKLSGVAAVDSRGPVVLSQSINLPLCICSLTPLMNSFKFQQFTKFWRINCFMQPDKMSGRKLGITSTSFHFQLMSRRVITQSAFLLKF